MICKEEFVVIHTLKSKGHSIRSISRITGLDRRTISKRLKEEDLKGYTRKKQPTKLSPYESYVTERILKALPYKIPSPVIFEEIRLLGYTGSIRTLQYFISGLKADRDAIVGEVKRFETKPGYQSQVDWTVIKSGKNPIYAFVMVLGFSRMAFVYFTDNMSQSTWQSCHIKAFEYFGGITKTILYDNLKSVVIKRDKYGIGNHGFNSLFLDFSKDLFIPKLCKPYRAKTKGKVERFNRYLKENFYIPLKSSLTGSGIEISVDLLNGKIWGWLEYANNRIHSTTNKKPAELFKDEKSYLSPYYKFIFEENKSSINKVKYNIPEISVTYETELSDYEEMLNQKGEEHVNA